MTGVSNATVNRILALLRSILNRAKQDWEWFDSTPNVRLLPEHQQDVTVAVRMKKSDRLLNELPEHLKAMARFTLATGLRESNVTRLAMVVK